VWWLYLKTIYLTKMVTYLKNNQAVSWPRLEPATKVQYPKHYTTEPPLLVNQPSAWYLCLSNFTVCSHLHANYGLATKILSIHPCVHFDTKSQLIYDITRNINASHFLTPTTVSAEHSIQPIILYQSDTPYNADLNVFRQLKQWQEISIITNRKSNAIFLVSFKMKCII